jgi:hypothetical protein
VSGGVHRDLLRVHRRPRREEHERDEQHSRNQPSARRQTMTAATTIHTRAKPMSTSVVNGVGVNGENGLAERLGGGRE